MIFKDYYKILGFDTNRVSLEELKIAFRENAKQYHPDVNVENRMAEERFKDVNEAYRVLSDGTGRKKYDRKWYAYIGKRQRHEENNGEKESIFSDFSKMFFGDDVGVGVGATRYSESHKYSKEKTSNKRR